jgi:Tpt1/KptA family lRNA 2'-phosphotransferase
VGSSDSGERVSSIPIDGGGTATLAQKLPCPDTLAVRWPSAARVRSRNAPPFDQSQHVSDQRKSTSKFVSFVLRHEPGAIGLTLDQSDWVSVDDLLQALCLSRQTVRSNGSRVDGGAPRQAALRVES